MSPIEKPEPAQPKARRLAHAARAIGVSRSTIYKLAAEGRISIIKIGRASVVTDLELDRFLRECGGEHERGK